MRVSRNAAGLASQALILLLSDYYGYAGVVFAVALAAAIYLR